MSNKISEVTEIKMENSNDLQSYLESFNREINEGNAAIQILHEDESGDNDEDVDGTYFVDQAGNYYYQATKDSEPVLTNPPADVEERSEGDEEQLNETEEFLEDSDDNAKGRKNITIKSKDKTEEISYVLIMDDVNKTEDQKEEIYEFDEKEESDIKKEVKEADKTVNKIVKILPKKENNSSNQLYYCTYCNYSSSKRYLLARHMKCHSEDRPHKCSVCERGFKTLASLQNHVNTHTGNKPHHCKYCDSSFTTSGELVRHVRYRHTHEKPHKCTECDYASVELSKLRRHIRCHTGERPYQCPHCTYASPDTFKLKRHLRIHTGEKPYECDICHARFTQSNSLKAHKLIHSVGEKPVFQCELCPTTCGRKTDLRIHVQKLHTSDKPLRCKRCGQSFPDRYSYKVHSKTHEGEKCYKCDLCPYASISARHLESHLLIHTDQKPYECEHCEQAFRQKQLLKRHINLYHNRDYIPPVPKEKTHVCPDCSRAFSHKGNLIRHMAMHDPESGAKEQQVALKVGRQKRIQVIDGQAVEISQSIEDDDAMQDINDFEESSSQTETVAEIKEEKELDCLEEDEEEVGDGQQYVVLEVIQVDQDVGAASGNGNESMEVGEENYIMDLPNDVINTLRTSKKLRTTSETFLSEDQNMENCFGFEDDDEADNEMEDKSTIRLIELRE